MYKSVIEFSEAFSISLPNSKHLLIVPITDSGLGDVIDVTFPQGTLGIRIMDSDYNSLFNGLVDVYEDYKTRRSNK